MTRASRGPLPPALFLSALLLEGALHLFFPLAAVIPGSIRLLGSIPIAVGIVVMVVADRHFKGVGTAISPFDSPSTLVTAGPFRASRNPMYLGMVLVLLGEAVACGTLSPFSLPPLMVWIFQSRFISVEEEALARVFGAEYDDYRRRVRRWL